jgi:hypothetical protein
MDSKIPQKLIKNEMMMGKFLNGKTITKLLEFIVLMQKSVASKSRIDCPKSSVS